MDPTLLSGLKSVTSRLAALQTIPNNTPALQELQELQTHWIFGPSQGASREGLVLTAEITFACKTLTKMPLANSTSSPLRLSLRKLVPQNQKTL